LFLATHPPFHKCPKSLYNSCRNTADMPLHIASVAIHTMSRMVLFLKSVPKQPMNEMRKMTEAAEMMR